MTQNERVMNLFRFMMDLLDDNKQEETKAVEEVTKKLSNPTLPHHPLLNPYIVDIPVQEPTRSPFSDPNSLFSRVAEIDKRNADELAKLRAVKNATKPLIDQIEALKIQGHQNALEVKREEELDLLNDDIKTRMGVTIENGVTKIVEVPTMLRNNIGNDESTESVVGYTVNNSPELKGLDDLPIDVRNKIESELGNDTYLKNSKLPQAIKDAMLNAPNVTITETSVELDDKTGEIVMKPSTKKPRISATKNKVSKKPQVNVNKQPKNRK